MTLLRSDLLNIYPNLKDLHNTPSELFGYHYIHPVSAPQFLSKMDMDSQPKQTRIPELIRECGVQMVCSLLKIDNCMPESEGFQM
jgi:hypothetical protein